MLKGCIFDLDGVIVDTAKYHFKAWARLADSLSIPFTEEDNEHLKGVSRLESLKFILSLGDVTLSEEETSKYLKLKNDWYIDLISDLSSSDLLEGIPEFLEHLKTEKIKIALGSASKNAMPVLVSTGILPYFDYISDGNSTDKSKPDPEVFYIAARGLELEPSECIVFEDAIKGVEAALNGEFKVIGIGEEDVLDMAHVVYPNLVGKTLKNIESDLAKPLRIRKQMKDFIIKDEWCIIEDKHHAEHNEIAESLCAIGNGHMGQRANFEEHYSGKTLQGSYVGGVYYPDKTRVGWWKNGYPEYFAKVLNAVNWIGLDIRINEEVLDINSCTIHHFERKLNMKTGVLSRTMNVTNGQGINLDIISERFVSMDEEEIGALQYSITATNSDVNLAISSYLDTDVSNRDSNYEERFWIANENSAGDEYMYLSASTKKTGFVVATAASTILTVGDKIQNKSGFSSESMHAAHHYEVSANKGQQVQITKYVVLASSRNHEIADIQYYVIRQLSPLVPIGFNRLRAAHIAKWDQIWSWCDVQIEGDIAAQQGIRFNIFHLLQTYTGKDSRLNIGPKGFTGEKYGGSTYWDTEAYCLPFYLSTTGADVARNLLIYRHNQLGKAIENAEKLGFNKGAALYPMVTMNGEECHNEWEITFEEIHRNGAIAYAIYDYINYTGDQSYLASHGLEVLIGISRFWAQRVNYSDNKLAYVMLGVTGPNEYENNVNNNWYTNYIAKWCLEYTTQCIEEVKSSSSSDWSRIAALIQWEDKELMVWNKISTSIYLPEDKSLGIKLQQDGYLDKEQVLVADLPASERPINQKWSWDRILRSCFIKQADVLQGMYFFEHHFSEAEHLANFDYYEPRTVHESSLSPCVHAILAAKLNKPDKAYELYLRTSRLDLDNYNNDTEDGLHITSMAGTWLTIVKGFAGMRVKEGVLHLKPMIPSQWHALSFNIIFRNNVLKVAISKEGVSIHNEKGNDIEIMINNTKFTATKESILDTKLELV